MTWETKIPKFRRFVLQNFPFIEQDFDALTDYELICKVVEYLNKVIDSQNALINEVSDFETEVSNEINSFESTMTADFNRLEGLFNELKSYVDNYFENLDVQDEINNKLDAMVEAGTLQEIVANYLDTQAIFAYDTLADMKAATNLTNGSFARTLGYYAKDDCGGALYKIRTASSDVDNGGNIIVLNNGAVAELILDDRCVTTKQFGCYGDATHNDTTQMQVLLNFVKATYPNGCTIKVVGKCLCNPTLQLKGVDENRLKNITITSIDGGTGVYSNFPSLSNGFIFDASYGSGALTAFDFDYIQGLVLESLLFNSTEETPNGEIPLNNIKGISLQHCRGARVTYCSFTNFNIGLHNYGSGLQYYEKNNFALCNVGCWLQEVGDSTLIGNYFNTNGWNIRNDDGTLKEKFTNIGHNVYGYGLWAGSVGMTNIIGGKCEWNDSGFYLENCTGFNISTVNCDYNVRTHIGITSGTNNKYISTTSVSVMNCHFISGCWTDTGSYLAGGSVCLWKANGVTICGNTFEADAKSHYKTLEGDSQYFGPKQGFIRCRYAFNSTISGNTFDVNKQAVIGGPCELIYTGNFGNTNFAYNNNFILKEGREMVLTRDTWINFVNGTFEVGDLMKKKTDLTSGWKCTESGTFGTLSSITTTVVDSDLTIDGHTITGDSTVVELLGTYDQKIVPGCFIDITGVTGTKRIKQIVQYGSGNSGRVFAKLDSACDDAVVGAALAFHAPTFTTI